MQALYGNAAGVPKAATVRQVLTRERRQRVLGGRYPNQGVLNDISILANHFKLKIPSSAGFPRFVHEYIQDPLKMGLWTGGSIKYAIRMMKSANRNKGISVCAIDSTGSFMERKSPLLRGSKRIMLYSMKMTDVLNYPWGTQPSISVGDFVTAAQDIPTIVTYIRCWVYHLLQLTKAAYMTPMIITVDWSNATLMGVCEGFNRIHLGAYLRTCWTVLQEGLCEADLKI